MTHNYSLFTFLLMGTFIMIVGSCSKDNLEVPVLTTKPLVDNYALSAVGGGIIQSSNGVISDRGICWSVNPNPTINDSRTNTADTTANYRCQFFPIYPNTKFYIRAYATNRDGTGYGNQLIIKRDTVLNTFNPLVSYGTVNDIDGNVYKTIQIGTQTWMAENLKVTHYRNGNEIPNYKANDKWSLLKTGATCTYENAEGMYAFTGKLYNWYAVQDPRNIAPIGWHIPSQNEFNVLTNYLGGGLQASKKMCRADTWNWFNTKYEGNNESGFTALPGGIRQGQFNNGFSRGWWWLSDKVDVVVGLAFSLPIDLPVHNEFLTASEKENGLSIRCVKDN